jgi:hypothetical protein
MPMSKLIHGQNISRILKVKIEEAVHAAYTDKDSNTQGQFQDLTFIKVILKNSKDGFVI